MSLLPLHAPTMTDTLFPLLGGIGLFLLGMVLLTDGLKAFAGDALRQALVRFTGTPAKAFSSGALVTLVVQSSSATTVTLIGFVSAGLITFPQAVGVVMGASLGTTGTGWIVSVLGLKISLGFYALPLVGIGALMRLLAEGRPRALGLALAGFGLIFIGIETLQGGMQGLAATVDLARLPATGFGGHLLAMLIGIAMTVILQSSSAAVATTLTALHAGAVNFEQAASLVIGAAIGTTITGALAAVGGTVPAQRTALVHVLFNLATGLIALVLLPVFLWGLGLAQRHLELAPGAISLAAFHTAFIAVGVLIFLPRARQVAGWIERLRPDQNHHYTRHLDDTLLSVPAVALEASRRALTDLALELTDLGRPLLDNAVTAVDRARHHEVTQALAGVQQFFNLIPPQHEDEPLSQLRVNQLDAIDHLGRLLERLDPPTAVRQALLQPALAPALSKARSAMALARAGLTGHGQPDWLGILAQVAQSVSELQRAQRLDILRQTATGRQDPQQASAALDAIRWLDRSVNHVWRVCFYLAG